jgi:hypothetical protein
MSHNYGEGFAAYNDHGIYSTTYYPDGGVPEKPYPTIFKDDEDRRQYDLMLSGLLALVKRRRLTDNDYDAMLIGE